MVAKKRTGVGPGSTNTLEDALKKHTEGGVIMMEIPTDNYFQLTTNAIKSLTDAQYGGVYLSFQRPFHNVVASFDKQGIDTSNIVFVDVATVMGGEEKSDDPRCMHVPEDLDIDEIIRATYKSLEKVNTEKKFIFMDSITTLTLYKPLSEVLRMSEFMVRTVRRHESEYLILMFNVSKDLAQKRFVKDIALRADEVVTLGSED